ncbi:recombinase family protein [Bacillus sp. ISL-18]|uniref:recombinase family protein n=1 Tax=Bacillus sp. ISL-18 TaxID=2819118 RepID=UPI001BE5D1A1|nr:recombinase family protein [Bacillus sp. ISL-18]MBT2656581.1 recombinase family protein [Bacillus sp. ISL-18]
MAKQHVAIFNRKSRSEGDTDQTLQNHRQITREICKKNGFSYTEYEEIVSGASKWEERHELIRLLDDVEKGLYYAVVITEISRLSRSGHYSQIIADTLAENNVLIITQKETIDLNNSNQRLLYDISSAVNSNEYRVIRHRMRTGTVEKAKRGEYVASKSPFGYEAIVIDRKRTLVPTEEAEIVKTIFNMAEQGHGMKDIAKRVNKPYKSVNNILYNKQYTGTLVFHLKDKKGNITEVIEVPEAFEAIVSMEQWLRVQEAIKARLSGDNEVRNRSRGEVRTILKDLVYCDNCGAKIGFQYNPDKDLMAKKCHKCGSKGINEKRLLAEFYNQLEFVEHYWNKEWQKVLDNSSDVNTNDLTVQLEALKSAKGKCSTKLKRSREAYTDGIFTKEEYLSDKADIEKDIKQLEANIREVEQQIAEADIISAEKKLQEKLTILEKVKKATDKAEINRLLKLIIDRVYYQRHEEFIVGSQANGEPEIEYDYVELKIAPK